MSDYFPAMPENRKNREISPMQDLKVSDRSLHGLIICCKLFSLYIR